MFREEIKHLDVSFVTKAVENYLLYIFVVRRANAQTKRPTLTILKRHLYIIMANLFRILRVFTQIVKLILRCTFLKPSNDPDYLNPTILKYRG